jgi:hypothetical protein
LARFILRYRGQGKPPRDDVERFKGLPGITVIDDSSRMLLVDAAEQDLRRLVERAPNWAMSPETSFTLPEPHPNLERARSLKRPK